MVTLCDCRTYGHVNGLYKLWSRYLVVQVVVTLSGCTSCGHVIWLYKLWSRYLVVQVVVTLSGCTSCGHVIWLYRLWSRYLTAQLSHISYRKCPSYFRLQSLIWSNKLRRFISKFVTARHWSLSWARSIRSTASNIVSLRSILTLRIGTGVGHLWMR
jgi:hypothetical protein